MRKEPGENNSSQLHFYNTPCPPCYLVWYEEDESASERIQSDSCPLAGLYAPLGRTIARYGDAHR